VRWRRVNHSLQLDHDYYGVRIYAHYIIRMEKIMLRATAYLVIVNGREEARR
jgi:hypothetical protein